jgi:hypothetical protein
VSWRNKSCAVCKTPCPDLAGAPPLQLLRHYHAIP